MCCKDCPFAFSHESETAINLGCLPDPHEITTMRKNGRTWACHADQSKPCTGALDYLKEKGIECSVVHPLITLNDDYSKLIKKRA